MKKTKRLVGIPVASGIVIGNAFILNREIEHVPHMEIEDSEIQAEYERFDKAVNEAVKQLERIRSQVKEKVGESQSYIFDAKIMMLKDDDIREKTFRKIKEERINCEAAFDEVIKGVIRAYDEIDDEYLSERRSDIENVRRRILNNLLGKSHIQITEIKEKVVVIAHDLAPSDTALINKEIILGFATDVGGKTSHTAIMARSLEIPAVVGLQNITDQVATGDTVIIDGNSGIVIINPDAETLNEYEYKKKKYEDSRKLLFSLKDLPAETLDGYKLKILANIELPDEVNAVETYGGDGIGLYRTEYLFMNRKTMPQEEEQFENYRKIAERMNPKPVTIRTFDLGGDKFISQMDMAEELNPAMGLRAIRFCLEKVDVFKTQIRAILRASAYGNLKILYPMISGIQELKRAKSILEECKEELKEEGIAFDENIKLGIMIEVPTAAIMADFFAREVDFFSIGTNDLIQYCLAIDRVNEKVAYLYDPLHPAILRLLDTIVFSAHRYKIPVCLCGEMSAEPIYAFLLLGFEIDELSTNPRSILDIKRIVRNSNLSDAKEIVSKILTMDTADSIRKYIDSIILDKYPEEFFSIE
ncbi:MAG: phosphoenolpyruvate--protein phosphotransferase [Candidatus Schekmanbacteria bacterium]|nr:MAG: phosphoenolpyruvate--protein phosphotransferase [Candidatus Schekmanbacteria bacterium]